MIILRYKYKTSLTLERINELIERKSNERVSIFKVKKFRVKLINNGFRIRERRFNEYQAFFPQIVGKYGLDRKTIEIKIQPSFLGAIFFGIFWFVVPVMILTLEKATVNGTLRTLDFADRLNGIGILFLVLIPITLIFFIWPNLKQENGLKMN